MQLCVFFFRAWRWTARGKAIVCVVSHRKWETCMALHGLAELCVTSRGTWLVWRVLVAGLWLAALLRAEYYAQSPSTRSKHTEKTYKKQSKTIKNNQKRSKYSRKAYKTNQSNQQQSKTFARAAGLFRRCITKSTNAKLNV